MLEAILIISFLSIGFHTITREGSILSFWQKVIRDYDENYRSELVHPVSECLVCMSSFWSCFYLGIISDMPLFDLFAFFFTFLIMFISFVVDMKYLDNIVLLLYLIGVFIFLLHTGFGITAFIVMFSVSGVNAIATSLLEIAAYLLNK